MLLFLNLSRISTSLSCLPFDCTILSFPCVICYISLVSYVAVEAASHLKAFMLMLCLLAVLSQQAMSLQLRRLAGSPGRCVAGWTHPWLIPLMSAQQGYVIPAGIHTVEERLLPGCNIALLLGWTAYALSLSHTRVVFTSPLRQQGSGHLTLYLSHWKWEHSQLMWFKWQAVRVFAHVQISS